MSSRQQCVRIKSATSDYIPIHVGVPQGTLSGPMFWLAFINSYSPPSANCLTMYANDITCSTSVACSTDDNLQPMVDWGILWSSEHKMTLNLDKTKSMMLTLGWNSKPPTVFSPVEMVTSWKFLGVIIDQYLNFHTHINYVLDKAQKKFYSLLQLKQFTVSCNKYVFFFMLPTYDQSLLIVFLLFFQC